MLYNPATLMFLITHMNTVQGLTCDEVLELPNDTKIPFYDLKMMTPKEITICISHLGRHKLGVDEAEYIWQAIIEYHGGLPNIPESVLNNLHWVTIAVKPDDYANMTLSNIDVISNFGGDYELNGEQLTAIANRVREDFVSKEPEDYTFYDLTALRQILCAFNRSEIERIHPAAYKEAAVLIGKLSRCSSEVIRGFATLAVQKSAFGPPETWTNSTLEALGCVTEYIPKDMVNKIKNREIKT